MKVSFNVNSCIQIILEDNKLTKSSKKYNLNILSFSEATRGCAGVKKNDGCKDSGNAKVCYCNDDMCNSDGFGNRK